MTVRQEIPIAVVRRQKSLGTWCSVESMPRLAEATRQSSKGETDEFWRDHSKTGAGIIRRFQPPQNPVPALDPKNLPKPVPCECLDQMR